MTYAICELEKGYVVCVCDEHGEPLMQVTQGFEDIRCSERAKRLLDLAQRNSLGAFICDALRWSEIFQPLAGMEAAA